MDKSLIIRSIEKAIVENAEGIIVGDLISEIRKIIPDADRKKIKEALRILNDAGSIMYLSRLGQTMVSTNINRSVRISKRIWISPPDSSDLKEENGSINIRISPGVAFGNGIHPTTKMCIRAMDAIFAEKDKIFNRVLDMGTGTGILAIAASLLGAETVYATDIDSCARTEASGNLIINGISENRIQISDSENCGSDSFELIVANLRYPTLVGMAEKIKESLSPGGYLIFSGFRPEEKTRLLDHYTEKFRLQEEMEENNWAAIILQKAT